MKKIYFLLVLATIIIVSNNVKSQVVDGISYQAVVIDTNGKEIPGVDFNDIVLPEKEVNIKFTILAYNNGSWKIEYQEEQTRTTDVAGIITCVIGHGTITVLSPNASILNIPWSLDKHFLKVEIDINKSGDYSLFGTQQMQAVPYALWALGFHETDPKWNGLPDINGNIGRMGNVGIGNTTPTAKLDITGQIRINDGTEGKGKVLTSDSSGLASWQYMAPPGTIIMYSGTWNFDATGLGIGSLYGWRLCNGYNNLTPDLTDKFVLGTTTFAALLDSGGSNTIQLTPNQLPAHQHSSGSLVFNGNPLGPKSVMADGTTVWGDDAGSVTAYMLQTNQIDYGCQYPLTVDPGTPSGTISGVTSNTGSGNSIDIRPAFVKLAYIMKL